MTSDSIRPISNPFRRGFGVRAWHDWDSFLPRMNWRDFCLVHVGGEVNPTTERVELTLCALGLWLEIHFAWGTAFYDRMGEMRDEFRARMEESVHAK